jgi:mannose-1-phosphate guanylyltransferase/phosphomannomutase
LGCTVVALNERTDESKMSVSSEVFQRGIEQLAAITAAVKADLGLRIDVGGERVWFVDRHGNKLSGTVSAAAFAELALRASDHNQPRTLAVMVNQPSLFDEIAERHGARVRRTKIEPQALMEAMADPEVTLALSGAGEFINPSFHRLVDGMFPVAKLLEFLATQKVTFEDVINTLPPYHVAQRRVSCPWEQKGKVMRLLNEQYKDHIKDQVDGLKISLGEREWVLIVPESDEPIFMIYAEGSSPDSADLLIDRYTRVIEGLRA